MPEAEKYAPENYNKDKTELFSENPGGKKDE